MRTEQRRVGDKTKAQTVEAFKSQSKFNDEIGQGKVNDGEEGNEESQEACEKPTKKIADVDSSDDEDDKGGDETEAEDGGEKVRKEGVGYDNDSDEDSVADTGGLNDDVEGGDAEGVVSPEEAEGDEDDDDDIEQRATKKISRKAVSTKPKTKGVKVKGKEKEQKDLTNEVHFNREEGWAEIRLSLPAKSRRQLMAPLAEKAAQLSMVRETPNIKYAYMLPKATQKDELKFVTDGVNFEAIWSLSESMVCMNSIDCNDIWQISQTFGIEAARLAIVKEIQTVFRAYGINVNARHLSLIADYMTRRGTFSAMNRNGMHDCPSPFLQMSFETTCTFLTKAALEGAVDPVKVCVQLNLLYLFSPMIFS